MNEVERMQAEMSEEERQYVAAREDPVLGPIIDVLHETDALIFNGRKVDMVGLAKGLAEKIEVPIRQNERLRVAELLEKEAATLVSFAKDQEHLLILVAFMLRLGTGKVKDYYSLAREGGDHADRH